MKSDDVGKSCSFFSPGMASQVLSPWGAGAAPARGSVIGYHGAPGIRTHFHQGIQVCCGERRLPGSKLVITRTQAALCSIAWEMGKGSSNIGWGRGCTVPPLWVPRVPAQCLWAGLNGMCGSNWGGKVGQCCCPLGGEEAAPRPRQHQGKGLYQILGAERGSSGWLALRCDLCVGGAQNQLRRAPCREGAQAACQGLTPPPLALQALSTRTARRPKVPATAS